VRPDIHPIVIDKFRSFAGLDSHFARVLDIGCGTAHSTLALTTIAASVIGVDPSAEMLSQARAHAAVEYVQAAAEAIPVSDGRCDLIVAAQAFHWFDGDAFMTEARRLLKPAGWLLIYNGWFDGRMEEAAAFDEWQDAFLRRYPTPPRNRTPITNEFAHRHGFTLCGKDQLWQSIPMSMETFIDFQLSTTNIIAAVQSGNTTFDDAAKWMRAFLARFFGESVHRTFVFGVMTWYLQTQFTERR
jgi:SAM-dependent methyltransferase